MKSAASKLHEDIMKICPDCFNGITIGNALDRAAYTPHFTKGATAQQRKAAKLLLDKYYRDYVANKKREEAEEEEDDDPKPEPKVKKKKAPAKKKGKKKKKAKGE